MIDILGQIQSEKNAQEKSFAKTVNALLALVKEREAEILRLRSGLSGDKKYTLDAIGKKMDLTRERVRQIENLAKNNIRKHENFSEIMSPAKDKVISALEEHGGLASKDRIAYALLLDEEIKEHKKYLEFLIDNFIDEVKTLNHSSFLNGWCLRQDYVDLAYDVISEIKKLIEERNKLIHEGELFESINSLEVLTKAKEKFHDKDFNKILKNYLDLSKDINITPFGQWGLSSWNLIRPKRVNDKIYLVLDYHKRPMHFKEIAEKINSANFDNKIAHPATIHNDLISDPRFVLLGRGIYALKEWGFKTGIVADLAAQILKEKGMPLDKEEIIKMVLEIRDIKPNTVMLALNKDERFERMKDGKYKLKA